MFRAVADEAQKLRAEELTRGLLAKSENYYGGRVVIQHVGHDTLWDDSAGSWTIEQTNLETC